VPQGATTPGGKSSLYRLVLIIVTIHVVFIGGMLLQGCKDTSTKDSASQPGSLTTADTAPVTATTPAQADVPSTINPYLSNSYTGTPAPAIAVQPLPPVNASVTPQAATADLTPPPAPVETKEYVIVKGDTLGAIARKNGLSLKALTEANPGVNAKRLHIGQKVQIPAGAAAVAAASTPGATAGAAADAAPADGGVYVVKSGDTLTKIAKAHGTSFKKIMALNDLKTTSIRVGQKIKLPATRASVSEPAATPASASVAPAMPAAAPMKVTAATPAPVAAN